MFCCYLLRVITIFSPHYLISGTNFGKKLLNVKICVLISSSLLFEAFLIVGGTERVIIVNVHSFHVKYPLFLPDFNEPCISHHIFEKPL